MSRNRCTRGKQCHETIEAARRHAAAVQENDRRRGREPRPGWVLEPYWCEVHSAFHIGHRRIEAIQLTEERS